MPLIERYVLRRATYVFFLALSAITGTLWVTQVLARLDVVTVKGQALWTFILMTVMSLPALIQVVAPVAFLAAAILTLNGLTNDSELPVIAAAGASRTAVNRPILVLGLFVTLAVAFSYHVVAPASLAVLRELITHVRADVIAALVQDGGFRTVDQGFTMHIREKAPDGSFRDIFISDDRDPNETLQYSASHGLLLEQGGNSYLVLQSGDLVRQDRTTGETNVVAFETYALDLSQMGNRNASAIYQARERSTLYLLEPAPDDASLAPEANRIVFELHNRIAAPLYTLVFALAALAFLGRPRTNRQDRRFAIATCVLLCVLLRTAGFAAAAVADNSLRAVPFLYAVPLSGIAFGVIAILLDARLATPRAFEWAWDRLFAMVRPAFTPNGAATVSDGER
jgi:lipopolysaccharide export system permease protein